MIRSAEKRNTRDYFPKLTAVYLRGGLKMTLYENTKKKKKTTK